METKPITIVGGGLAGLTLGIGLRQRNVPVVIRERGRYPRHRVCGEFVSGRGQASLQRLGLDKLFLRAGAISAETAAFFSNRARSPLRRLPSPAFCLSRYLMDEVLAREFLRLGGDLHANERWLEAELGAGCVRASGRRVQPVEGGWRWYGAKAHASQVELEADLEMHLAANGYVGLCRLAGGEVNVCGLFRRRAGDGEFAPNPLELLRGTPPSQLSRRLARARFDERSECSVAGISLRPRRAREYRECCIGDAVTMIPPVTGNGMSMAFESAELAIAPLAAYSRGELSWDQARARVVEALDGAFAGRLAWARCLQWMIFSPLRRGILDRASLYSELLWRLMFDRTR